VVPGACDHLAARKALHRTLGLYCVSLIHHAYTSHCFRLQERHATACTSQRVYVLIATFCGWRNLCHASPSLYGTDKAHITTPGIHTHVATFATHTLLVPDPRYHATHSHTSPVPPRWAYSSCAAHYGSRTPYTRDRTTATRHALRATLLSLDLLRCASHYAAYHCLPRAHAMPLSHTRLPRATPLGRVLIRHSQTSLSLPTDPQSHSCTVPPLLQLHCATLALPLPATTRCL